VRTARGFTYFELLATMVILTILAAAVMPTAKVVRKRQKEIELRRALRQIRTALDDFQALTAPGSPGQIAGTEVKVGSEGYPEDLDVLVKGVSQVGKLDVKKKFLRRIPFDPMTNKQEWGKRCYQDDPDDTSWCGENVYDVYSLSAGTALDGTKYKEW
jgi:general secretion pathway protein G